jgi:hypothetical protein
MQALVTMSCPPARSAAAKKRPSFSRWFSASSVLCVTVPFSANAQDSVLEFQFTPTTRAQVAIWVEDADGHYLSTVALTESVAFRGIGNRPGASQMNSGYRWPYGRREGVLPIWAHRRASAPGAMLFPRVIFQARPEGYASKLMFDQSRDAYYCLQFDPKRATRDELDAVSCATVFSSDKGRYLTPDDQAHGYAEPWEDPPGVGGTRALPLRSLYPPRMDIGARCSDQTTCYDHADVERYAADARAVMPELDSITRATPPGDVPQKVLFNVPTTWPPGQYRALIEVNVEGDYNARWSDLRAPTPLNPVDAWDSYAFEYGYAYRGQPSIVYEVPFTLDARAARFSTDRPLGRSSWDVWSETYGQLEPVSIAQDDPEALAFEGGSGIDRLRSDAEGQRFTLEVRPPGASESGIQAVGPIAQLSLHVHPDPLRSHAWVQLSFQAADSKAPLHEYEVRIATEPMNDDATFIQLGRPAKNATLSREGATALMLPVDAPAGSMISSVIGDLSALTHYYVGVRATDLDNRHGPVAVAEITTTKQTFATVSPCFIATAAYGTPLAKEVTVLRRFRDRQLLSNAAGRELVDAYYAVSPRMARSLEQQPRLRATVRALLWTLTAAIGAL